MSWFMEKDPWFVEKDPRFSFIEKRIHGMKHRFRIHGLKKWNDTLAVQRPPSLVFELASTVIIQSI